MQPFSTILQTHLQHFFHILMLFILSASTSRLPPLRFLFNFFFPTSCTLCQSCVRKVFWKSSFYFFIHNTNDAKEVRMKNLMHNAKKELILFPQKTFKLGFHHFAIKMRYFNVLMYIYELGNTEEKCILYIYASGKSYFLFSNGIMLKRLKYSVILNARVHRAIKRELFHHFFFVIYFFESRRGQKIFWSEYFFYA